MASKPGIYKTVSDYCRHLIQSPDLPSKLAPPRQSNGQPLVIDTPPPELLRAPARAQHLQMTGNAPKLPKMDQLGNSEARAKCLHRFAHHDLQAVELFAWAILRWPQMPAPLKKGFLNTIAEEQKHLGLYLERLKAHGIEFGHYELSDYFWRHVPTLDQSKEGPKAFLSAMGLTLEQANLDFTLMFKRAFEQAGDLETAKVLQVVHDEEIGHVRLAKTWLNKLESSDDDLGNYLKTAPFPFGPTRAKGRQFFSQPRQAATLSPEFIDHVENAQKNWAHLDVELICNFGAEEKDLQVNEAHTRNIRHLFQLFWQHPTEASHIHSALQERNAFLPSTRERVSFPWLATTAAQHQAQKNGRALWGPQPRHVMKWHPKQSAITWSRNIDNQNQGVCQRIQIFPADYFETHSDTDFKEVLQHFTQQNGPHFTLKPNWGFSGRGRAGAQGLNGFDAILAAAKGMCAHKEGFVLEPWLNRIQDFSILLWIPAKGDVRVQVLELLNTTSGVYAGHENQLPSAKQKELKKIGRRLAEDLRADGYVGPAGIDAFAYEDKGQTFLRPVVEINARMTMGHLAWWVFSSLGKQKMRFAFHPKIQAQAPEWATQKIQLFEKGPLVFLGT